MRARFDAWMAANQTSWICFLFKIKKKFKMEVAPPGVALAPDTKEVKRFAAWQLRKKKTNLEIDTSRVGVICRPSESRQAPSAAHSKFLGCHWKRNWLRAFPAAKGNQTAVISEYSARQWQMAATYWKVSTFWVSWWAACTHFHSFLLGRHSEENSFENKFIWLWDEDEAKWGPFVIVRLADYYSWADTASADDSTGCLFFHYFPFAHYPRCLYIDVCVSRWFAL